MTWRDVLGITEAKRVGPYPIGVEVFYGGALIAEKTFLDPAALADFVTATYAREIASDEPPYREVRVSLKLSLDARDVVSEGVIAHLFAVQMGG